MSQPLAQLRSVAPQVDAPSVQIADSQEEFLTIYACKVRNPQYGSMYSIGGPQKGWNTVLLAFRPDEDHRKAIAEGADIYVSLLTGGHRMQPIIVQVGKESAAAAYNVPVEEGK